VIELRTDAEKALTVGVHEGVRKGSGRMIVGSVTAEVYGRIEVFARKGAVADVASKLGSAVASAAKPATEQTTNLPGPVAPSTSKPDPVSATDAWDALQVGSYVVGKYWTSDGEPYGWWLGIIAGIDNNDFIIRWPDEPKSPPLKIERKHVAILHPAFDVTREWERRR